MKNSTLFVLTLAFIAFVAWTYRDQIKAYLPAPVSQPVVQPVQPQQPMVQPPVVSVPQPPTITPVDTSCQSPIQNPIGCKATVTRNACAGMVKGNCEVQLSQGTGILVYAELEGYYMTTLVVDGHNLPFWIATTSVYVEK